MRLLPSPSISSSSNAYFDANLCTSKSATASCLTGILHRFLCSRSLPTYHDQTTETSSVICDTSKHREVVKSKEIPEASISNAPGLVARLMGLKSLPARVPVDQQMRANSVSRSQSLNSVERRGEGDQMQGKYRTVPIFLEIENKDFLVLGFEDTAGKSKRSRRRKTRKYEMGTGELEEERRERCKRKNFRTESVLQSEKKVVEEEKINEMVLRVLNEAELRNRITVENSVNEVDNEDLPNIRPCLKDACQKSFDLQDGEKGRWTELKQVQNGLQLVRKKTKKINYCELENEEPECSSSQDCSPVSVFDFGQFVMDPEPGVTTSEEDTNSGPYCSRRTLSMELLNHDHLLQRSDDHLLTDDKKTEQMRGKSKGKACHNLEYTNTWSEICRMVETHLQESNSLHRMSSNPEDLEDICRDIGMRILDELLEELVDQICLTCHEHF